MFRKIGRCASGVTVELLKMKCLPVLFYGLEYRPLTSAQTTSLAFAINSAFSKIFRMKSTSVSNRNML